MSYVDLGTLSEQDQRLASTYITLLQQSYKKILVILGVYRGADDWDIRPVFLDPEAENAIFVMRVTKPAANIPEQITQTWNSLPRLLADCYIASGLGTISIENKSQNIYWSLRKYCNQTLDSEIDAEQLIYLNQNASSICINLISQLSELETRVTPHGHLTKSNIGIIDRKLCLLDPWYFTLRTEHRETQDEQLSPRSFSSLFLNLFGSNLSQELILSLQSALTSSHSNQSFSELFKSNLKSANLDFKNNINSNPESKNDILKDPAGTQTIKTPQNTTNASTLTAPAGRIISPKANTRVAAIIENPKTNTSNNQTLDNSLPNSKLGNLYSDNHLKTTNKEISSPNNLFSNRGAMFFIVALITCLIVMMSARALRFSSSKQDFVIMQEDWESNSPARQKMIAQAALEDADKTAQEIIEADLLAGNSRPGVNPNFIRIAFNKLWRDQLSSKDELFAFSLALAGLYRVSSENLPALEDVHPGVILSLLGDLSLQRGQGKFDSISTDKLSTLPGAYGAVFSSLNKLNIKTFADSSARAAARLITGASDQESFDAFIPPEAAPEQAEERLNSIVPFCEMYPNLAKLILTSLANRQDYLADRVKWFVEDPIAQWNQVDENTLVYISIGLIPENMQNFERIVDLLSYPLSSIRDQAKSRVTEIIGKPFLANLFKIISDNPNVLSRSQVLGLLASTRVSPDKLGPFLGSWLNSNPNPQVVLQFLLACRDQKSYEASFVQLANYLARSELEISINDIGLLLNHPEPLARALAFPRLDPSKIVERKILESWLHKESSPRLKEQIEAKLNSTIGEK